jgi:hypothetical protein
MSSHWMITTATAVVVLGAFAIAIAETLDAKRQDLSLDFLSQLVARAEFARVAKNAGN